MTPEQQQDAPEKIHYPSGLTERSGSPELTNVLEEVERKLAAFDYQGAVDVAATQNIGMNSRLQARADIHTTEAINAHRAGNEEEMVLAITRRRLVLAVIGLPYDTDIIAEYLERSQKNGHPPLAWSEERK